MNELIKTNTLLNLTEGGGEVRLLTTAKSTKGERHLVQD